MDYFVAHHAMSQLDNCPRCQHTLHQEHPFYICLKCQLFIFVAYFDKKLGNAKWNFLFYMGLKNNFQKGAIINIDYGQLLFFLRSRMPWLHLIGIEDKKGHSQKRKVQKSLERYFQKAEWPIELQFASLKKSISKIEDNSLDFVFLDDEKQPIDFLKTEKLIYPKLSEKGILIGRNSLPPEAKYFTKKSIQYDSHYWIMAKTPSLFSSANKTKLFLLQQQTRVPLVFIEPRLPSLENPSKAEELQFRIEASKLCEKTGHLEESQMHLNKAKELHPHAPGVLLQACKFAFNDHNYELALSYAQQVLKTRSKDPKMLHILATIYQAMNHHKERKDTLDTLVKIDSKNPTTYYLLADFYLDQGFRKKSYRYYKKGIQRETQKRLKWSSQHLVKKIAFVCCGDKYGPEYVTNLITSIQKHTSFSPEFICFTDHPERFPNINCVDVSQFQLKGWWNKLLLFHNDYHQINEPFLYLDLDQFIINWLDPILMIQNPLVMMQEFFFSEFNSSVMIINPKKMQKLYNWFERFDRQTLTNYLGDQNWITEHQPFTPTFPATWCGTFIQDSRLIPKAGSRVISFHLADNKPHQQETNWVKQIWNQFEATH